LQKPSPALSLCPFYTLQQVSGVYKLVHEVEKFEIHTFKHSYQNGNLNDCKNYPIYTLKETVDGRQVVNVTGVFNNKGSPYENLRYCNDKIHLQANSSKNQRRSLPIPIESAPVIYNNNRRVSSPPQLTQTQTCPKPIPILPSTRIASPSHVPKRWWCSCKTNKHKNYLFSYDTHLWTNWTTVWHFDEEQL